jgi:hypothetical protein
MRLDRTASLAKNGRINKCGFRSFPPSPANRPINRSASDKALTSIGVQANSGGKGSGAKARYPPGHRTFFPGIRSLFPAIRFLPASRDENTGERYFRYGAISTIAIQALCKEKTGMRIGRGKEKWNSPEQFPAEFEFFAMVEAGGVARMSLGGHAIGLGGAASG